MENREYGGVIGSGSAQFTKRLAHRYALATHFFAVSHPSLPNYLALTGGSTFGITDDCTDCSVGGSGIVGQLESAGYSWKAYMQGMPHACYRGAEAGSYAKKHDPFMYYDRIRTTRRRCNRIVRFGNLSQDLRKGRRRAGVVVFDHRDELRGRPLVAFAELVDDLQCRPTARGAT